MATTAPRAGPRSPAPPPAEALDPDDPLGFLCADGVAQSVTEAAYRFCRHTPGMDAVLTGSGSVEHLEDNVHGLSRPPLPALVLERLAGVFGGGIA